MALNIGNLGYITILITVGAHNPMGEFWGFWFKPARNESNPVIKAQNT